MVQDVGEQASRDCDLGKLERDIATVADDLGSDLHQLFPQRAQRSFNVGYWLKADVLRAVDLRPLYPRKQT